MIERFSDGSFDMRGVYSTIGEVMDLLDLSEVQIGKDILDNELIMTDLPDKADFKALIGIIASPSLRSQRVANDEIQRYVLKKKFKTQEVFQEIRSLRLEVNGIHDSFRQLSMYLIKNIDQQKQMNASYSISEVHDLFPMIPVGTIRNKLTKNKYKAGGLDRSVLRVLNYEIRFVKVNGRWLAEAIDISDVSSQLHDYDNRRKLINSQSGKTGK